MIIEHEGDAGVLAALSHGDHDVVIEAEEDDAVHARRDHVVHVRGAVVDLGLVVDDHDVHAHGGAGILKVLLQDVEGVGADAVVVEADGEGGFLFRKGGQGAAAQQREREQHGDQFFHGVFLLDVLCFQRCVRHRSLPLHIFSGQFI